MLFEFFFFNSLRAPFGDPPIEKISKNVDFSLWGKQCILLPKWTFSRVRAHWCLSDEASNLFFDTFHYLSISYFSSWYAKTFPLPYLNRVNNLIETIAKVPNEVLVLLVVLEESFDFACKNKWKMMDLWSKQDESGGNEIIQ